ncbi:hypothetical protein Pmar_PMAR012897, partial [Perkinsus marinus ATCC 50983]
STRIPSEPSRPPTRSSDSCNTLTGRYRPEHTASQPSRLASDESAPQDEELSMQSV